MRRRGARREILHPPTPILAFPCGYDEKFHENPKPAIHPHYKGEGKTGMRRGGGGGDRINLGITANSFTSSSSSSSSHSRLLTFNDPLIPHKKI